MNTRIQFEMSETRVKDLEQLMDDVGIGTRRDLFNNALALLEWVAKERRSGRIIASVDEANQNYKELVMPALFALSGKTPASPAPEASTPTVAEEGREAGEVAFANAR